MVADWDQRSQTATAPAVPSPNPINPAILDPHRPVRDRLRAWQEEFGGPNETELGAFENYVPTIHGDDITNGMSSRLSFSGKSDEELHTSGAEEDDESDDLITIGLFLKPGDIVEIS